MNNVGGQQVGGHHYEDMPIDIMEFCYVNNISYIEGNIIKYAARWKKKGGLQDLEKGLHYFNFLVAKERAKQQQKTEPWSMKSAVDEEWQPATPEDGSHHSKQEETSK